MTQARIIAIANQKGGAGKTTTATNVAAKLAMDGYRVLLIDADPQSNATAVFAGLDIAAGVKRDNVYSIYDVIVDEVPPHEALLEVEVDDKGHTLHLMPSRLDLAAAELVLSSMFDRDRVMANQFRPFIEEYQYEYVLIDCPPSLGLITLNALMTAKEVLIPVAPGYFDLIGINFLVKTIKMVQKANRGLHVLGALPTRANRTVVSGETKQQLERIFGHVLPPVPDRIAINEAHGAGMSIYAYDPSNDAAKAYTAVTEEIKRRG